MRSKLARVIFTVRNIAATFPGDQDLRPAARVLFQQQDISTLARSKPGREQSRRAAANNNDVILFHVVSIFIYLHTV